MWNPFKKGQNQTNNQSSQKDSDKDDKIVEKKSEEEMPKMNMLQRLAMKKMAKMSPQEQQKLMQEAFKPGNRDKLLSAMEMMRKSGQISEEQYQMAKKKMGM